MSDLDEMIKRVADVIDDALGSFLDEGDDGRFSDKAREAVEKAARLAIAETHRLATSTGAPEMSERKPGEMNEASEVVAAAILQNILAQYRRHNWDDAKEVVENLANNLDKNS